MNDKPEKKIEYITPLKRICMTIGELPSSYLETMTYYEMLVWFTKFLQEKVIPTIDNNAEAVKELQILFIELQNYVNNYFDNLDVQEEINNKLDDMLEQGILEQIIEQFLQLTSLICFDNVAEMKSSVNLANGSYARTLGYYSKNDGGGAIYKIRTITNDDVVDEMTIIALYDDSLISELIINNPLNIKCLGAKGDGINNDTNALKKGLNISKNIKIDKGIYLLNENIEISNDIIIHGNNATIKNYGFQLNNNETIIYDLNFNDIDTKALSFLKSSKLSCYNCSFDNIGTSQSLDVNLQGNAIHTYANDNLIVDNCKFTRCHGHGAIFINDGGYYDISNSYFDDNHYRAITMYETNGINEGKIHDNIIKNCGINNPTSSGAGCNGIYGTGTNIEIYNNYIYNVVENGIESTCKSVHDNYIDKTGADPTNHPTPSTQGIYINRKNALIYNNIIKNAYTYGIAIITGGGDIENHIIKNNIIESNNKSVYLNQTNNSYKVKNCHIENNIVNNKIYINRGDYTNKYIGSVLDLDDTCSIKVLNNNGDTRNIIKYFNDIGDFTASLTTPTFNTDDTLNIPVMQVPYVQYARIFSPYFSMSGKGRIQVELYGKGDFTCALYKGDTSVGTIFTFNTNTYETKINALNVTDIGDYRLRIQLNDDTNPTSLVYIKINIFE